MNPFLGVMLGGVFYKFDTSTYRGAARFKTTSQDTQGNKRHFSTVGLVPDVHLLTILLENTYSVLDPATGNELGDTTWLGVSRLAHLKTLLGASSVPLTLVLMDGVTHSVVPTGMIDYSIYTQTLQPGGVEYRVNLTLEEIS